LAVPWDNNPLVAVLVFAVIGLMAALAYWSWKRERERQEGLVRLAAAWGLRFSKADPIGIPGSFAQFELFNRGDTHHAYNVIHGAIEGRHFCACDYQYTRIEYDVDEKGNQRRRDVTTYCSAAMAELDPPVPALWLRPENLLDKAAQLVGVRDIEFESAQFNREFHVKAANREIAFDILTPQVMERLLASPFRHVEFNGAAVMVFAERLWMLEQFAAALELVRALANGLPNYLADKLRERMQS
jgi:hypothetical protein